MIDFSGANYKRELFMTTPIRHLARAKMDKINEFYTLRKDIDAEMRHYEQHFDGSVVYCNCDTADSNFVKYFKDNEGRLGLAGLLYSWNDFRSPESVELLKEADIIISNPPFSLFREYVAQIIKLNKQFLIVGPTNALGYHETFMQIREDRAWLGVSKINNFKLPSGEIKSVGSRWFTNLTHNERNKPIPLTKRYSQEEYPVYFNYNAINVNRVADIPVDYGGPMGVPITFLDRYCPDQFEIVGLASSSLGLEIGVAPVPPEHKELNNDLRNGTTYFMEGGVPKSPYSRIIIKNRALGE